MEWKGEHIMSFTDDTENKINKEIVLRAVNRSGFGMRERERRLHHQDILDALEDVTHLPRWELESISRDVRESYARRGGDFFSVKHQAVLAASMGSFLFGLIALAVWMLFFRI